MSTNNKSGVGFDCQVNENELLVNKSEINDNVNDNVFESASDSSVNETEEDDNQANNRYKIGVGYHVVPPPFTGNFMPPRPDLSFAGLDDYVFKPKVSETIISLPESKTSASKTSKKSVEEPKTVQTSAPIIKEWKSDSDDECEIRQSKPSYTKISFVKSDEYVKASREPIKQKENVEQNKYKIAIDYGVFSHLSKKSVENQEELKLLQT
ncbi:hypothetical protein Tco_0758825 [Tanacetum coccineum]